MVLGATVVVDDVVGGTVVVVVVVVAVVVGVVVVVDDVGGSSVNSVVEAVSSSEPPHAASARPPATNRTTVRRIMTDIMSESARDSADPRVTPRDEPNRRIRSPRSSRWGGARVRAGKIQPVRNGGAASCSMNHSVPNAWANTSSGISRKNDVSSIWLRWQRIAAALGVEIARTRRPPA